MADNLTPVYPDTFPQAAAMVVVDKIRGVGDHDVSCLVHAGWILVGYGLGVWIPDTLHATRAVSSADVAEILEGECKGVHRGAIPWNVILPVLFQLIQEWLKSKA